MPYTGDFIPDNFDIDLLSDPTDESRQALEEVFDTLTPLATQGLVSEFDLEFELSDNEFVEVYGKRSIWRDPGKSEGQERTRDDLGVIAHINGHVYKFGVGNPFHPGRHAKVFETLPGVAGSLEDGQDEWFRSVYTSAIEAGYRDLGEPVPDMVNMLEGSPFGPDEYVHFSMSEYFENGSQISAHWTFWADDTRDTSVDEDDIRKLTVTCADGSRYYYKQLSSGEERLFIKKASDQAPADTSDTATINRSAESVARLPGQPNLMEILEYAKARRSRADIPTEGDIQDFLKVIKDAFASGLTIKVT